MTDGVMSLHDMFDSDTVMSMKITKKFLGAVQYRLESSTKSI
uniref:Uncharacterized protein n=1 Tax=viral metagenome TaxID=1070528 RepID=A0A6C0KC05_9ZZZZ